MKKRVLALLLAVMLIVSVLAACGSNTNGNSAPAANNDSSASNSSEPANEPTGEIETIVYAIPLTKTVDMEPIEAELNKITEPKIGVHVEIEGIQMANFTTQLGLMMSGEEPLDCFGFLGYIWGKGRNTTIYERLAANNRNSQFTPVMGFSYDSTKVSTELAAISNVANQYLPGLTCGSLNPETELPKFLAALDDAGAQRVIEEKTRQLEEWKAANQ